MEKKIFLTGHLGFIGGSIKNKLLSHQIYRNYNLTYDYIDIKNKKNWINSLRNSEIIIHCGARAHITKELEINPLKSFREANTETTKVLVEEAINLGVKRIIFLSSIGVNGNHTEKFKPFSVYDTPMPSDYYAISKWEAEQKLWQISNKTNLEVVVIRAPLVYGPEVGGNFLRLLNLIHAGIPLPFAKVDNLKSFISIDNLIDLIFNCIEKSEAPGNTFLASDNHDISSTELINKLSFFMGKSPKLYYLPLPIIKLIGYLIRRKTEVNKFLCSLRIDNSITHKILGWKPPHSLNEGLEKMVHWYLKNKK